MDFQFLKGALGKVAETIQDNYGPQLEKKLGSSFERVLQDWQTRTLDSIPGAVPQMLSSSIASSERDHLSKEAMELTLKKVSSHLTDFLTRVRDDVRPQMEDATSSVSSDLARKFIEALKESVGLSHLSRGFEDGGFIEQLKQKFSLIENNLESFLHSQLETIRIERIEKFYPVVIKSACISLFHVATGGINPSSRQRWCKFSSPSRQN
jgi:hypothetical protein